MEFSDPFSEGAPSPAPTPEPSVQTSSPRNEFAVRAGEIEFEGKMMPVVHDCTWDEATYVAFCLDRGDLIDRTRVERYAHWRYRGFLVGEIASL